MRTTRVVAGRDELHCSEHGHGECDYAEELDGHIRVLTVDDIADEVAQSRAVQEQVLENVKNLDNTGSRTREGRDQ